MKLALNPKNLAVVVAALSGLSFSTAYAAPNYIPPANTPLDATLLDSSSALLDNFNGYLGAIQAQLTGKTLALPTGPVTGTAPTDPEFYAAVAAAVAADTAHAAEIVSAAIQFKPSKVRDIVRNVVAATPLVAPEVVGAASTAVPAKAGDAATGAILALINAAPLLTPNPADLADAADDVVIALTRELIERVAKSAVAATKTAANNQEASAIAVAESILTAYLADAEISNADLFIDDIGRGALNGAHNFANTDKADVAAALIAKFATASGVTREMAINFSMGALKGSLFTADTDGYDAVSTALTSNAALEAAFPGVNAAITAGSKIQKLLRTSPVGTEFTVFSAGLGATEAGSDAALYGYVSGAVQALKGKAADFVKLALEDAEVSAALSVAGRKGIASAAITSNFGATSKVVTNSINATKNALTAVQAVEAAIPAASDIYSGVATLAALKTIPVGAPAVDSTTVLSAAIDAAVGAEYERSLGDIALNAAKAKKIYDNELIATAIADVPAGWEESVAAYIIANNPKESVHLGPPTAGSNEEAAINAAISKGADVDSVQLAMNVAQGGKLNSKILFDAAIEAAYANPTKPRAILFGAGAVNAKLAGPLLGMLMRLQTGGDSREALFNYTISLSKKTKVNLTAAYEAAVDAIDAPDNIFDMVDHKVLTNVKYAPDIVGAVAAARPEYAHYAARAAAFRAPGAVGKTAAAAIQYGHMRSNRTTTGATVTNPDDPAAVAAIAAAAVLGVKDAKLTATKEESAIKSAVSGMVKAALAFQNPQLADTDPDKKMGLVGNDPNFPEANGAGDDPTSSANYQPRRTKGTAAVLTGAVAQLQVDNPVTGANELELLNPLAKIAITAAAKAAKAHSLALAQAAGAAAAAAAAGGGAVFSDFAGIVSAWVGIVGAPTPTQLLNAARLGANQYLAVIPTMGAGAAGIQNYSHRSGTGSPVTDLSNF